MRVRRLAVVICTVVASMVSSGVARAQTTSALVLETNGATVPHLKPYSEIPVGTTVSLPIGDRLVFLHYATCRTVTVVGGAVTFDANAYTLAGGTKESHVRNPCPRTVALRAGGEMAGALLRGGPPVSTLSTRPSFVLVGQRAGDFASVRVSKEGKEVLAAPLDGRRFRWPMGEALLAKDAEYELALVPRASGADPVTMRFRVKAPSADSSSEALTLVKVE
jgi:hypothetical protein